MKHLTDWHLKNGRLGQRYGRRRSQAWTVLRLCRGVEHWPMVPRRCLVRREARIPC